MGFDFGPFQGDGSGIENVSERLNHARPNWCKWLWIW